MASWLQGRDIMKVEHGRAKMFIHGSQRAEHRNSAREEEAETMLSIRSSTSVSHPEACFTNLLGSSQANQVDITKFHYTGALCDAQENHVHFEWCRKTKQNQQGTW